MGHQSRDAGAEFEGRVENALIAARQAGVVAWWTHQQPAFTLSRRPIKASGADFAGMLVGGCSLAVEAKAVKGARLMRSAVAREQSLHLDAVAQHGGLALLAVEFRDAAEGLRRSFLVPWSLVPWRKLVSAESVDAPALEQWAMPVQGSILSRLRACLGCGAYHPLHTGRSSCCAGGPPF